METEAVGRADTADAVVLAGGVNRIPLYPGARPGYKALVELRGRPLVAYVLDCLRASPRIGRVFVLGSPEVREYAGRWPGVTGIQDGHSLLRNVWRGLQAAGTERVLFCNPDQPLLRTEMVDDFVERALPVEKDIVSSWARHETLGRYRVEGAHKFCKFGDDCYAHGNLWLVRKRIPDLERVRARLDRVYAARKSNLRFAWALGPKLFGRFLLAKLRGELPTLEDTLNIGGEHFGLTIAPVISPYPEIVLDIDEPEDFAAAEKFLAEDGAASRLSVAVAA